ncbi:MAG TPA: hypothetical protein DGX96_04390 [Lachnospiraceae bacterium]|jgi:hypothetical protein|nr:hypothetical protein [Lachnospiraceae bacterium]
METDSRFRDNQKKSQKAAERVFAAQDKFDTAWTKAGCRGCENEQRYAKLPESERYQDCSKKLACHGVRRAYAALQERKEEERQVRDVYARQIYETFSKEKPRLKIRQSGEIISWDDAWDVPFAKMSDITRNQLIALIDEDGGKYRLADR